jgi:hypothetical protein
LQIEQYPSDAQNLFHHLAVSQGKPLPHEHPEKNKTPQSTEQVLQLSF